MSNNTICHARHTAIASPGVTYPAAPTASSTPPARRDDPRGSWLSSEQIMLLFGCSRSQARRIGSTHGGTPRQAKTPDGRTINYYRAQGILIHRAREAARYETAPGVIPSGYLTRADACKLAKLSPAQLRHYAATGRCRTTPGLTRSKRHTTYYAAADCRAIAQHASLTAAPVTVAAPPPVHLPRTANSLDELAPWIHVAGLYARVPSRTTLKRWKRAGLIITRSGAAGRTIYDVPATIAKLRNPYT